jgi:hypothetical protein
VQGIGFSDGTHALFYSFAGNRVLDIEAWVPSIRVLSQRGLEYFQLRLPTIGGLFSTTCPHHIADHVNDLDGVSNRSVYFDNILNISSDLPAAPNVSISQQFTLNNYISSHVRNVGIQFQANVVDPDSDSFTYLWEFGNGQSSNLAAPYHLYTVTDDLPTACI